MEIKVTSYGRINQGAKHRLSIIAWYLAETASQGKALQLVHPSQDVARALEAELDVPVLSAYDFSFAFVDADKICVIDGDIIDARTVQRLEHLRKEVCLLVPDEALSKMHPGVSFADVLKDVRAERVYAPALAGDEEQPKTFGCHHFGPTCGNCDSLVADWKAKRRERALAAVA
jgi:hypothetical protein